MAHGNELNKKRYFFLKIPQSFFRSLRMRKLKRLPNGHEALVIYLEMMELSADNSFVVVYEGVEETIEEELAFKLEEDVNSIKLTFNYLKTLGLLEELENGDIRLPEGQTLVSSFTYSALVKKEARVRKCLTNVQPMSNNIDIEKDIEKEKDIDIEIDEDNELF